MIERSKTINVVYNVINNKSNHSKSILGRFLSHKHSKQTLIH